MEQLRLAFLEREGLFTLFNEPMIFHCNHYNIFLQRTIEDAGDYIPAAEILTRGATVVAYSMFRRLFESYPDIREPDDRLKLASDLYSKLGFGLLPIENGSMDGEVMRTPITHYSLAWQQKWGKREKPVDYFTCGYLQAAFAISYYKPPGFYKVEQKRCLSMGDSENEFEISTVNDFRKIPQSPGTGVTIKGALARHPIATNIDENGITDAIRGLPLEGDADGLIPVFGIYFTRHFANYYNYITYEAERAITEATGEPDLARDLFIEAGHQCAFHTFGGVMESDEWYGLVEPQCQTREDWVSGMIAVVNAFGWGSWTAEKLQPGKMMILRADGSYESNGYLGMYSKSILPRSYLLTGGAAGLMNLLYNGDITEKPTLDESYYHKLLGEGSFTGKQIKCRSMGDEYCEVEVPKL